MRQLNPNDPNVVMLERVAQRLGTELCDQFAFVGGAIAGLLITDPANPAIRPTEDVDVVAEVLALSDYHRIEGDLRKRGFKQDMSAEPLALPNDVTIRVIQAPVFIGTKLEAFHGRGHGNYLFSHDLGDIISVVDGRDSLFGECKQMPQELRAYLARQFSALLADRRFLDALPGHLPGDAMSQSRLPDLEAKIQQLADLAKS